MQWKVLIRLMPRKELAVLLGCTAGLLLICFIALGKVGLAYNEANETMAKVEEMTAFVGEWNKQRQTVEKAKARPVPPAAVDQMQSDILLNLAANELQLTSFKTIQTDVKKANGLTYEMTCRGSWENTARMLEAFASGKALIGIERLKLAPSGELVEAKIMYKIYVK